MTIFKDELVYEISQEYFEEVKEFILALLEEWEKKFSIEVPIEDK